MTGEEKKAAFLSASDPNHVAIDGLDLDWRTFCQQLMRDANDAKSLRAVSVFMESMFEKVHGHPPTYKNSP
jgi:hypothetical protein